jgi:FkbH-like protein
MIEFSQLRKNLTKDFSKCNNIKIGLLGDTSTQLLHQAIRGMGFEVRVNLQIWEAPFDQIEQQVLNPTSELYHSNPDIIIIFQSSIRLLEKYNKSALDDQNSLAENSMSNIKNLVGQISERTKANIIFYNFPEIDDAVFGNYGSKVESSFLFQLRKLNYDLMVFAKNTTNLFICDLSSLQNQFGRAFFFQPSFYITSEISLSIDVLPNVAKRTIDIILASKGNFKKCIILDLDNTLWGGIIGDDGIENIHIGNFGIGKAFTDFQYWLKKMKARGILLSVCSKNTESIAREPFEKHPDMILRMDDFAVFVANWNSKTENIRYIKEVLNIGYDSFVFIDDSAFERDMVRNQIPEIFVPEMPEDPSNYLEFMYTQSLFETASFSMEDLNRTELYQVEVKRTQVQQQYSNEEDYLNSLEMTSTVEPFNSFNIPRIAQLCQRSNQFNLRTIRYSESELEALGKSNQHFTLSFTHKDKFGNNGLISVVILKIESDKILFIDTWLMSCRVLKRGMEHFILNTIAELGKSNSFQTLRGEYLQTVKNEIVKDLYSNLGFDEKNNYWYLDLDNYQNKITQIQLENSQ